MNGNFVKDQVKILQEQWGNKAKFTVLVISYPKDIKTKFINNNTSTFESFGNPEIKVYHCQPEIISHKVNRGVSRATNKAIHESYSKVIAEIGEPDFIWAVTLTGAYAAISINEIKVKKTPFILQEHSNQLSMHIKNVWQKEQLLKMQTEEFSILPVAKRQEAQFRFQNLNQPLEIVPNPVSESFFDTEILASKDKGIEILCVGRLSDIKDPLLQVEIAKELKSKGTEFTWNFIGDGEMREEVEQAINKTHLDDFILHGYKSKDEILKALQTADVFVLTSKSENCPVALIEAQAMGVPCVVVKNDASEYVVLQNNGKAESNNPVNLANAISELADYKRSESLAIRERAYAMYSPEIFAGKMSNYIFSNSSQSN
jgi:glycosyltransferase involved in cell wall biosynthesis